MSARRGALSLVAAAGLILTACGSSGDGGTAADPAATLQPVAESAQATSNVDAVMVPTADGTDLDFNSLRGQDVLLWFWAPW